MFENAGRINFSTATAGAVDVSKNYWGGNAPAEGQLSENVNITSYYAQKTEGGDLTGLVTIPDDLADVTKTVTFEQVMDGETATNQINIYLEGSQEGKAAQIENLIAADLTFVIEGQFAVTDSRLRMRTGHTR